MCFSFVCCVFQILVQDPNEGLSINSSRTGFIFAGLIYDSLGFEVLCEGLKFSWLYPFRMSFASQLLLSTDAFARQECSLLLPPIKKGRGIIQLR